MKHLVAVLVLPTIIQALVSDSGSCPDLLDSPLPSHLPSGLVQNHSGIALTPTNYTDFKDCVTACCDRKDCNAALNAIKDEQNKCWFVSCSSDDLCLPSEQFSDLEDTVLVLVHPNTPPWKNISVPMDRVCEDGLEQTQCRPGEICHRRNSKSRNGVCRCDKGYLQTKDGCEVNTTNPPVPSTTPVPETINIAVSVANKTIRLPVSEETLTAFTVPSPTPTNPYTYHWQAQTKLPGQESDPNSETLKLSGLGEGVYVFKVTVRSLTPAGQGEAMANVTVLPVQRINTPPKAVIVPVNQTVTLPTNKAVIDGSSSSDDGTTLTYAWTINSGPMGYQPKLPAVATLTLDNLIAGNYSVKLVVTDGDGVTDSALSILQVLKETDYPPKANAGEDKIVYLPQNSVILNGNQSSDDHEIATWEWTKKKPEEGEELPADITGARSPYLKVANLATGIYNFELKVTDSAGNSRTDEVSVYVKPPSNLPPKANAGEDQVLNLPLPLFTLDGSLSSDDLNITSYSWTQLEGPQGLKISKPDQPLTNVTNLVPGVFKFQLSVVDDSKNTDKDIVTVEIKQDSNQAPLARIKQLGPLFMPLAEVVLDGSGSTDDLSISSWQWQRLSDSVAAGTVVGKSDGPLLVLTDLVDGIYSFSLKVVDAHGKSDVAKTTFKIGEDPNKMAGVTLTIDKELTLLTQVEVKNILETIQIFVKSKMDVELLKLIPAARTGFATLTFRVRSEADTFMAGSRVVAVLEKTLNTNAEILGLPVLQLETTVCQNDCGGHGTCDESTRECRCQPFWMENFISRHVFRAKPNCDWSVIYVVVGVVMSFVGILILYCCCRLKKKKTKYSRLGDIELTGRDAPSDMLSTDTDTEDDEDILFEANNAKNNKRGRKPRGLNGSAKHKSVA